MKVVIDVKSVNRMNKLNPDDILIYDGKVWYVTTKEDLFSEEIKYIESCKEALEELKKDNLAFKKELVEKVETMNEVLTEVVKTTGKGE